MRRDGPAAVQVRIDERRERGRRLEDVVQTHAQLSQRREIRPEARRRDDPLGGILSFSTRLLYPHYADRTAAYGIDALTDQRIGGALMWVVGDAVFLLGVSLAFFRWLEHEEETQRRRERGTLRS